MKAADKILKCGNFTDRAAAVFEARGEILTVPAEKGNIRNLTRTTGAAERDPSWSPDGKWIAFFSDESGEYALHLVDQSGLGEVKKINLGNPPSYFYNPVWSRIRTTSTDRCTRFTPVNLPRSIFEGSCCRDHTGL